MRQETENILKFSKQIILKKIGVVGQKKIFRSKVMIIGMGGLGCPLVQYLATSGIGNIGLVDHDRVEISNLSRQILFNKQDIGKYKVISAKKKIGKISKKINISTFVKKLDKNNIKLILKDYDIICDGTDNYQTRYLINDYCLKNKKILISAAISKFSGHVFKFNFKKKIPCFRCFMPEIPSSALNCETDGVISTIGGIIGTMQANEVIKTIVGLKDDLNGNMLVYDSLKNELRKIKLTKNSDCILECKKK